ncbi:MAG TPA: hypothetical protein DHW14_06240 [Clostridiales bacterium]|nr:hypothetical protein [Clostridiales bacterium]
MAQVVKIDAKHMDCRNFCPVDVVKGICRKSGSKVIIDSPVCPKFEQLPKCKNCAHYTPSPTEEHIGTCGAAESKPWTPAELIAVTCENYQPA